MATLVFTSVGSPLLKKQSKFGFEFTSCSQNVHLHEAGVEMAIVHHSWLIHPSLKVRPTGGSQDMCEEN